MHDDQLATKQEHHGSLTSYIIGFALSIILTLAAYFMVTEHLLSDPKLILTILFLGVLQALVQVFFFLHLGNESKPHWNIGFFLFMILVLVILVFGSLWIMDNLDYRVMGPMEMHT